MENNLNLELDNDEEIKINIKPEKNSYILRNILLYIILTIILWVIAIFPLIYTIKHNEVTYRIVLFELAFILIPLIMTLTMYFINVYNLSKINYIITNKNLIHINNKGRILKISLSLISDVKIKKSPFNKNKEIKDYYIDNIKEPIILYNVLNKELEEELTGK